MQSNEFLSQQRRALLMEIEDLEDQRDHLEAQINNLTAKRTELSSRCQELMEQASTLEARIQEPAYSHALSPEDHLADPGFSATQQMLLEDVINRLHTLERRVARLGFSVTTLELSSS